MGENAHPSAGRVSPALSSMSDSLPTVHTPLMVGLDQGQSEDSNNNYDTNDVHQNQQSSNPQLQHCHSQQQQQPQQPQPQQQQQQQQQQIPYYHHPIHQSHPSSGAEFSGQSESFASTSSTPQPHHLHHTGLLQQCLALQHTDFGHSLSEGMDLPMTVCPGLEQGDTPTFTPSGEHSFSSSHFLENGSLPTICTPLMESKSETCSFIFPSTAPSTNNGDKSETTSISIPICRICHMSGEDGGEVLISPCRCAGTLQFIHNTCLQKWLEIMSKKSRKPPKCELCHFQYHRHKKFKFHHWRFPRVSRQDKILHIIFIANLIMMIGCAVATVMSFLSDKGTIHPNPPGNNVELSTEEIVTLSCGVLFFVSFFIAMSVQIKAKHTIYQLFVKFIMQNMEWEIDEYDKSKDTLYKDLYKGLPVYV